MKQTASPHLKNYLTAGTKTRGTKSYGEWLREEKRKSDEKERQRIYQEAALRATGYGSSGEELAKAGLVGDGYAAYLQREAERTLGDALTSLNEKNGERSLQEATGYADYLSSLRESRLKEVEKTVDDILNAPAYKQPSFSPTLSELGLSKKQIEAVLDEYKGGVMATEDPSFIYSIARHLTRYGYSYERAYVFCRTAGISEEKSLELATLMSEKEEKQSAYMQELLEREKKEKKKSIFSYITPYMG